MTWLQIELRATPTTLQVIEETLQNCGAVSITLLSDVDEPVLEPNPGETPLWSSVRLQALFDLDTDLAELRRALYALQPESTDEIAEIDVQLIGANDWQDAARTYAVDQVFAERLWLLPKDMRGDDKSPQAVRSSGGGSENLVRLYLEPGLAFGSGSHPTTSMCLAWLAENIGPGQRVLDFGCGSGVLGIAAALLGATVVAVDHDPQAVIATQENAAYNGLTARELKVFDSAAWQAAEYASEFDVVVANILAAPLQSLAGQFEQVSVAGAQIVLSGVLAEQAATVMSSYRYTEFRAPTIEAGWACLLGATKGVTEDVTKDADARNNPRK